MLSSVLQIAIGGTIGTGLFVGSGGALAAGGPVGVWVSQDRERGLCQADVLPILKLGYIFMSTIVYAMMVALGGKAFSPFLGQAFLTLTSGSYRDGNIVPCRGCVHTLCDPFP